MALRVEKPISRISVRLLLCMSLAGLVGCTDPWANGGPLQHSAEQQTFSTDEFASRSSYILKDIRAAEEALSRKMIECEADFDASPLTINIESFEFLGASNDGDLLQTLYVHASNNLAACSAMERNALAYAVGMGRYILDRAPNVVQRTAIEDDIQSFERALYDLEITTLHDDQKRLSDLEESDREYLNELIDPMTSPTAILNAQVVGAQ